MGLASCGGTVTGNPATGTTQISVQGILPTGATLMLNPSLKSGKPTLLSSSTDISVTDSDGNEIGVLTVTTAEINIGEIRLKEDDSDSGDDSKLEGPYIADLLANSTEPAIPEISISEGVFAEMQVKIEKSEDLDSSNPLNDHSIYIAGTYTGETSSGTVTDVPFTFLDDLDEEFAITGDASFAGLTITSGETNSIILAFKLGDWFSFSSDTFSDIEVSDGEIVLDEESSGTNHDIQELIRDNIKSSAKFGKDSNDDGELNDNEDNDSEND